MERLQDHQGQDQKRQNQQTKQQLNKDEMQFGFMLGHGITDGITGEILSKKKIFILYIWDLRNLAWKSGLLHWYSQFIS